MHSFATSCWAGYSPRYVVDFFITGTEGSCGAPVIDLTTSKALGIEPAQLLAPANEVIE